ncbi:CHAT domain-containing protein [Streptomyces sp. NPDC006172]|uniref:CHAT domain-containing protein n=1 Tax=Streptomyces sp. NPDC006172 TaxID=3154470 RepID=UPI0033E1855F
MADLVSELTIRLDWDGQWSGDLARITAVVMDGDVPRHAPDASAPVAKTMLALWQSRSRTSLKHLAKALFPPSTRPHLRDAVRRLGLAQRLRVRLRLPAPAEGQSFSLSELPWELVQVPVPDAGDGIWNAWVSGSQDVSASMGELGGHERFTLVREFRPRVECSARSYGLVLVADATGAHGTVRTPSGDFEATEPQNSEAAAEDSRSVELVLQGSHLKVDTLPSPAWKEAIRERLVGGAGAFYFGGHHVEDGLIVADGPGSSEAALLDGDTLSDWLVECGVPLAVLLACDSGGQDEEVPTTSRRLPLAERMVRDGVPHVVAVRGKASHQQAAEFAGSFFASLAAAKDIDVALSASSRAFAGSTARPVLYSGRGRRMSIALDEKPRPRPSRSTDAHRIAQGSEEPVLPDERFRVSLETRWSLFTPDAGKSCAYDVVADPSRGDLAEPLNEWERMLHRAGLGGDRTLREPRRWYTFDYDKQDGRLPNGHDELVRVLGESYRPRPRKRPSDQPPAHRGVGLVVRKKADGVRGRDFVPQLQKLPDLDWDLRMIVVQIHGPIDAVRRAADTVARELGLPEYLVKAPATGGPDVRGGRAGAALLDSLRLAATDDGELDRWLSAAAAGEGRLPVPDDFRGLKVPSTVVDAVVLALIRSDAPGRPAALAAWVNEGPSHPVRWAVDAKEHGVTAQDLSNADHAIALDRAGLLPGHFRQLDPEGLRRGSWARLARRQPTEEDANWLWGMVPAVRRLAGLEPDPDDYDYQLDDALREYRTAFRPELPNPT